LPCLQRVAQALGELDDGPVQHGVQLAGPQGPRRALLLLLLRLWLPHGHQRLQALQECWRCLQRMPAQDSHKATLHAWQL
jgi:hypothetical protein